MLKKQKIFGDFKPIEYICISVCHQLEAKRADLDKEIEGYLKELGIC